MAPVQSAARPRNGGLDTARGGPVALVAAPPSGAGAVGDPRHDARAVGHRLDSCELHCRVLRGGYRRQALPGLAGAGAHLCLDDLARPARLRVQKVPANDALLLAGWLLAVAIAAEATRIRAERAAATRASRQLDLRRRQSEERLRIARDLHDVIGHNISLINVQASMGLDLMDSQPEQARAALSAIKSASKEALEELRTMLTPLRGDDDIAPRSPVPGLDSLPSSSTSPGPPASPSRSRSLERRRRCPPPCSWPRTASFRSR